MLNYSNSQHSNFCPSSSHHTTEQQHKYEHGNECTQIPSSARSAKTFVSTRGVNQDQITESPPPSPPPSPPLSLPQYSSSSPPQFSSSPHLCSPWGQHILFTVYQSYVR